MGGIGEKARLRTRPFNDCGSVCNVDLRTVLGGDVSLDEELARLAAFHKCTVVGGVLEEECNKLFRAALNIK
jgi:hypothetical protein